jgi:hypothetical protein
MTSRKLACNAYEAALEAVRKLSPTDRARLVCELGGSAPHGSDEPRRHSILELRGLGKEVWAGVNPDEYVEEERASWDG